MTGFWRAVSKLPPSPAGLAYHHAQVCSLSAPLIEADSTVLSVMVHLVVLLCWLPPSIFSTLLPRMFSVAHKARTLCSMVAYSIAQELLPVVSLRSRANSHGTPSLSLSFDVVLEVIYISSARLSSRFMVPSSQRSSFLSLVMSFFMLRVGLTIEQIGR